MRVAVALLIATAYVAAAHADDAADQAAFAAATQRLGDGDLAGARAGLEALAAAAPDGRWADDALAEAAGIAEQQGDLAGARRLWKRVVDEHPDGRLARRAAARLATLIEAGGADGAWDAVAAEHDRLVRAASAAEDPHASLHALAAVLDRHPTYPRWFGAALWLGEAWARIAERRDAAAAERLLRSIDQLDRLDGKARAQALADVARRRFRDRVGLLARIALGLGVLAVAVLVRRRRGSWRGAARALWPPPLEVVYLAPVALGLVVVGERGNPLAARAIEVILVGGLGVAWLSGVVLRSRAARLTTSALILHVVAVLAALVAIVWIAVMHDQLLDLLIETWRSGHDAR